MKKLLLFLLAYLSSFGLSIAQDTTPLHVQEEQGGGRLIASMMPLSCPFPLFLLLAVRA